MHAQPSIRRVGLAALATIAAAVLAACTTTPLPPPAPGPVAPPAVQPRLPPPPAPTPPPQPATKASFIRPAPGPTLTRFDGKRSKGIDIAGRLGEPVLAAADGRVVYVGGELRGYGNMTIVKHDDIFLTAYAHAQRILVKEGDVVRQGQTIAEMGSSDANRVELHFEIRRQGTPVDPEPYLNGQLLR